MIDLPPPVFEQLVEEAIGLIPDEFRAMMNNLVVIVEKSAANDPELLGLYEGVPLTERTEQGAGDVPDRITLYRESICAICRNENEVREEVAITVIHEVAHFFGIDEERLVELGWD